MAFAYRNQHKVDLDVVICVRFWAFGTSGAQNQESYLRETLFSKTLFWKYSSFSNILKYTKIISPPYANDTAPKRKLFGFPHTTILRILVLEIHRVCVSNVCDVPGSVGCAFGRPIASRRGVCFYSLFSNMSFCASSHVSLISKLRVFEYSFHLSL